MRYELKRPAKKNFITFGILLLVGVALIVFGNLYYADEVEFYGIVMSAICVIFIVYEHLRTMAPKFFFDENGFYVGETRYSYKDIEKVKTSLYKSNIYVKIIVAGKKVYSFDNTYENSALFFDILSKNGVSSNLFR